MLFVNVKAVNVVPDGHYLPNGTTLPNAISGSCPCFFFQLCPFEQVPTVGKGNKGAFGRSAFTKVIIYLATNHPPLSLQ